MTAALTLAACSTRSGRSQGCNLCSAECLKCQHCFLGTAPLMLRSVKPKRLHPLPLTIVEQSMNAFEGRTVLLS